MERPLKSVFCALAVLSACSTLPCAAHAAPEDSWHVWTVTETRKLRRSAPAGETLEVRLDAAANEWESFQILVRAEGPVDGVRIEPTPLVGPDGHELSLQSMRLYRQHQLHLTEPTFRNQDFEPGWYPDPLIPWRHPVTLKPLRGARYTAMPFDLPAKETHGFWIDLNVPPDTPPGEYRATYRVRADGQSPVDVPVILEVWGFTLPARPAWRTALGSPAERMRRYYERLATEKKATPPDDWAAVDHQCAEMLHEHRINATPPPGSLNVEPQPDRTLHAPDEQIATFQQFVDRYHVNAYRVPHPNTYVDDPDDEKQAEVLEAWLHGWDDAIERIDRPGVVFYIYLCDEPATADDYVYVQRWGRAIHMIGTRLKVLVTEQTWPQDSRFGDLHGCVDIWCPLFSLYRPTEARRRQKLGEQIWTYTALCQRMRTPWWHIDYPLLNYRVPAWTSWRFGITGLLYWGGMANWRYVDDPWTDPQTLDRREKSFGALFNGEGVLVYPARAVGYEGIAPSIRLKALRDGIEDYDYLTLAALRHEKAWTYEQVMTLTPHWFKWNEDPQAYEETRRNLARAILGEIERAE